MSSFSEVKKLTTPLPTFLATPIAFPARFLAPLNTLAAIFLVPFQQVLIPPTTLSFAAFKPFLTAPIVLDIPDSLVVSVSFTKVPP